MIAANQATDININRVYSTCIGIVLTTSIIIMGNGTVTMVHNYDDAGQKVSYFNEKTNICVSFPAKPGISFNLLGYSNDKSISTGIKQVMVSNEKIENIKKLEVIASLQDNWNANGAKAFSAGLISKVRNIIVFSEIQPEVFPTACESIQLEYDKQDGSYMEIELTESEIAEIFVVDRIGCESIRNIQADIEAINEVVRDFYG